MFVRQNKLIAKNSANSYCEVSLYNCIETDTHKLKRAKRSTASLPKQKKLNDEHSRRYFRVLVENNFAAGDYCVHLTYKNEPNDMEAAKKELCAFIRKARALYKSKGVEFRAVYVTESGGERGRLHHHIVVNSACVSRDEVENLWRNGFANCVRLKQDTDGTFNSLENYLVKSAETAEKHHRTWSCTRNIKRPVEQINDNAISNRKLRQLLAAKRNDELKRALERIYKGYTATQYHISVNEETGFIYARFTLVRKGVDRKAAPRCRYYERQGQSQRCNI